MWCSRFQAISLAEIRNYGELIQGSNAEVLGKKLKLWILDFFFFFCAGNLLLVKFG